MESEDAIVALAALAQSTRLDVFRLLVKYEPDGLAAGDIAKAIAVPQNTMSSHLSVLSRAGLISARRFSRSIVYRAELNRLRRVVLFMLQDCCDGGRKSARRSSKTSCPVASQGRRGGPMSDLIYNVLFPCTACSFEPHING